MDPDHADAAFSAGGERGTLSGTVRVAATGLAFGAPRPIIRHRFGGNLRAARNGSRFADPLHQIRVPSVLPVAVTGGPPADRAASQHRDRTRVGAGRTDRVIVPEIRAIDLEEECA